MILEVRDLEVSLLLHVSFHIDSLNDIEFALGCSLLSLILVTTLYNHFYALGNIDLHRVNRELQSEFINHFIDLAEDNGVVFLFRFLLAVRNR